MEYFKIWMICAAVCVLDSVVLEKAVTSCEGPTVIKNMTPWYVNVLCNIQKANSSRDNYSCQLLRNAKVIETQRYSPVNNVNSTCNFTTSLPAVRATYTYEIIVAPGAVKEQIGNVTVASPTEDPILDCPPRTADGFFEEHRTIYCTCTAANLGQPTGKLIGYWNGRELASGYNNQISWRVFPNRNDDGGVMKCVLKWMTDLTTTLVIKVRYPPSPPTITYASQRYPFMEGETPTLYCHFPVDHDAGNPPATLTLSSSQSDKVVGQKKVNVTLTELTYSDNNKTFFCTARNAARTSGVSATFKMQVYYKPRVTLTRQLLDACRIDLSDPRTCVVEDGERVQWKCQATGFPNPSSVAWQHSGRDDLDLTARRSTQVQQVCEARTARLNYDPRLPLRSSVTLRVLVKYQASIKSFRANNTYTTQFTANKTDSVSLACIANGRPTPNIRILKGEGEMISLPQGQVTAADEVTLTYLIPEVRCQDAGEYRCEVTNGQGTGTARFSTVTLTVNCKSSGGLSGGAIAGIAVAVVVAVIIAVLVWLWRRYWTLPTCSSHAGPKRRRTKKNAMETNQNSQDETDLSTVDKEHIYSNMEVEQQNKQVGGKQKKKRRPGRQSDRENGGKDQDNADCKPYENWSEGSRNVYEIPRPRVEEDEDLYDHIPDQPGAFALMPPGYPRPSAPAVSTTDGRVYSNDDDDNTYANFGRVAAARKRLEMLKLQTPK